MKRKTIERSLKLFIYTIFSIWMLYKGLQHAPDSIGYLENSIIRGPGYPLLLDFIKTVSFGFFDQFLLAFQLVFAIFGVNFFVKEVKEYFQINDPVITVVITFLAIFPCFFYSFFILSEAVVYPLFLIFIPFFLRSFLSSDKRLAGIMIGLLLLLMLTRSSFIFVVPTALVVYVLLSIYERSISKHFLKILLLCSLPLLTGFLDKSYQRFMNGHFTKSSLQNIVLLTPLLYVAEYEDHELFLDKKQQEYFKRIYQEADRIKSTENSFLDEEYHRLNRSVLHYAANYNILISKAIRTEGILYLRENNLVDTTLKTRNAIEYATKDVKVVGDNSNEDILANEKMAGSLLIPLFKDNFKDWLVLFINNFIWGIGTNRMMFILPILLGFSFLYYPKNKRVTLFIFISSLLAFANMTMLCLVIASDHYRYTIYNDVLIYTSLLLLFYYAFYPPDKKTITSSN